MTKDLAPPRRIITISAIIEEPGKPRVAKVSYQETDTGMLAYGRVCIPEGVEVIPGDTIEGAYRCRAESEHYTFGVSHWDALALESALPVPPFKSSSALHAPSP